jgi:hypothetical protein
LKSGFHAPGDCALTVGVLVRNVPKPATTATEIAALIRLKKDVMP